MSDFLKIFLVISAVVSAFVLGRGYGEKTFLESADHKEFAKAKEELGYAKSELENAKVKLQNLMDSSDTKKTDELLSQILNIFLVDLGLRIQNRDAILKAAQGPPTPPANKAEEVKIDIPAESKQTENQAPKNNLHRKFKSNEWIVQNSENDRQAIRNLRKLELKNLKSVSLDLGGSTSECAAFLGTYQGSVYRDSDKRFGSLKFEVREKTIEGMQGYFGTIDWFNAENGNPLSQKFANNCGKKITGLEGRIFEVTNNRAIQVYKLGNLEKLGGNFYEILPNGATNWLGAFVLGRTDIIK